MASLIGVVKAKIKGKSTRRYWSGNSGPGEAIASAGA
jgi:hypothetical protein